MKKKNNIKIKFIEGIKIRKVILKILYIIISICILYNVIFLLNTTISKKDYFSLFGISLFSMENDSMEDEIRKNALIITSKKDCNEKELKMNDIIVYEMNAKVKTSKIINIQNTDGKKQYITKANNNYYPDNESVVVEQMIGKLELQINSLGTIIKILQSKITTLIIIILLILKFAYNKFTYKTKVRRRKKKIT